MAAWMLPKRFGEWTSRMAEPLDRRSRKYWLPLIVGVLFATGRRTAACWFAAAGVQGDWQDHYYFLSCLGRKTRSVATELLKIALRWIPATHVGEYVRLAIDDSPTKRYGPMVQGAGIHHNPTPGPAGNAKLSRRLDELEAKYDARFRAVFEAIRELMTPPETPPKKGRIGFQQPSKDSDPGA